MAETSKKTTSKRDQDIQSQGPLDIIKHRMLYLGISMILLLPGLFFIVQNMVDPAIKAPVRLGIDFTGGTMMEYGFHKQLSQADLPAIRAIFEDQDLSGTIVQIQDPVIGINKDAVELGKQAESGELDVVPAQSPDPAQDVVKVDDKNTDLISGEGETVPEATLDTEAIKEATKPVGIQTIVSIRSKAMDQAQTDTVIAQLQEQFGELTLLQKYSIGPSMASELLQNGLMALVLAYVLIVGYLTYRFEFDYAVTAIIALLHDALFVFGVFAILGHFFQTEVDTMFITAILTVIGFSVHDTIVVFDRIRENHRVYFTKKVPFTVICNLSVNQTLARSINTSLSTLLPLIALYFFGGETTKDFVLAAIVGITVGTYSSISVASLLLAWWREKQGASGGSKAAVA